MRKWAIPSALLLLIILSTIPDHGRKFQANVEDSGDADELENPLKVEEKLRAVPSGVSMDSDVTKSYFVGVGCRRLRLILSSARCQLVCQFPSSLFSFASPKLMLPSLEHHPLRSRSHLTL